jgi:hypothetical protein
VQPVGAGEAAISRLAQALVPAHTSALPSPPATITTRGLSINVSMAMWAERADWFGQEERSA